MYGHLCLYHFALINCIRDLKPFERDKDFQIRILTQIEEFYLICQLIHFQEFLIYI
jgi:hypothetical protein